ncbi:MAG TPA: hypothetical protein PK496_06560, partial [Bacteroidales bacterium]|nr:hypothetical protein [Bacteroidales bacterium]
INIVVLEEGTHLKSALPFIVTDSTYTKKYGMIDKVGFEGWFDIIDPKDNEVVSKYRLETLPPGDSLLEDNGLQKEFPAVIVSPENHRTYYFCGDFTANKVNSCLSRFNGIEKLKGILYSSKENDPRRFFWLYYRPLINSIFTDYYNSLEKKK